MVLAGTPATMTLSGTSFVTTVPAATMAFSPTVTPGRMIAPAPIHALRFITIGFTNNLCRKAGSSGWFSVTIFAPGPINTPSSNVIPPWSESATEIDKHFFSHTG